MMDVWRMGAVAVVAACAVGCGPTSDDEAVADGGTPPGDSGIAGWIDAGAFPDTGAPPPPGSGAVFAHSNRQLYRIDPDTLTIELVGTIQFSDGINQLTDLAIDRDGRMIGVSFREVYAIDPETADASLLAELEQPFNGLSFVPRGDAEVLVGTAQTGELYEIDPATGAASPIGAFGGGLGSSGDVVSVTGLGTFATVMRDDWTTDHLAAIDPATGAATEIGDTGVSQLWGLGFWNDRLFGFSSSGDFVVIDVSTGVAEVVESTSVAWWGAAVTTSAPVVL